MLPLKAPNFIDDGSIALSPLVWQLADAEFIDDFLVTEKFSRAERMSRLS